jgi:predicted MFS family arabinose efflux permease
MSLISRTIPARGRALGVNGIFGNLAIAATPFVTARLCEDYGWQGAYGLSGFAMCAVAVACGFLPVTEPAHAPEPFAITSERSGGNRRLFLLLCCAAMLGGLSYRGNTLIQPAYFAERVHGLGFGATTSLVYLFGIGGQYLGGILADRRDLRWLYFGFHALSLPALLLMATASGVPLIGAGAVFVFFSLGMQPIENSLVAHYAPPHRRATIYGLKFVCTFGVGSLAVWLVEWAGDAGGLENAILLLAGVVMLVIAAATVLLGMDDRASAARERVEVRGAETPRPQVAP